MNAFLKIAAPRSVFGSIPFLLVEAIAGGLVYYVEIGDRLHQGLAEMVTREGPDGPLVVLLLHVPTTGQFDSGATLADHVATILAHLDLPSVMTTVACDAVGVTGMDTLHDPLTGNERQV